MNFNDLKNIDPKNIGSLPLPVKGVLLLGILIGVSFVGGALVWKPMLDDLKLAEDKEWGQDKKSGLRGEYETKLAQAAGLSAYKAQLNEAEKKSTALLNQLPEKAQIGGLLADINQAGIGRGLEFNLFKPGAEKVAQLYAELPINISVVGNYHDLGAFAADVAKMPRIVTLSELSITFPGARAVKNASQAVAPQGKLTMDAVAKTFRALDKSEAPAPTKKKPGKKDDKKKDSAPKGEK